MGKKVKNQQQVLEVQEEEQQPTKATLQKYLPHNKYITKKTKLQQKIKQSTLQFIKLDKFQINKAVTALKQYINKTKNIKDLFQSGNEGFIYIQIDLAEVPQHYSIRPIQIPLPNPIYTDKYNSRYAVFTSQPNTEFLKKIEGLNVSMLSEAIGYDKAKKHYRNNLDKLRLLNQNDLFFCDWKIYNLLRKPLGKLFYEKKRYPFPINCEQIPQQLKEKYTTYEEYLNSLLTSTYTMLGNGPVYALKVGRVDMTNAELVKNIMRAAYRFLPYILQEVDVKKVRQISIKGYNSPCLPIYNYISEGQIQSYRKFDKTKLQKKQE